MRHRWIAVAIATGLGITRFSIAAASTPAIGAPAMAASGVGISEVEQLKAELVALQVRMTLLEQHADGSTGTGSAGTSGEAVQKSQTTTAARRTVVAKPANNTGLSGKMYFDFTRIAERHSDNGRTDKSGVGLDVKRFYLGVSHRFTDVLSANLTTDFSYASAISQTSLYVKKAYVQGKFGDAAVMRVGSADLPWVPFVENAYGFRYVENTLIDRLKYGTSADWGLHLGGQIGPGTSLGYAVSVINGAGYRNPGRSKSMDVEGRVGFVPFQHMVVAVGGYSGKRGKEVESTTFSQTAKRGNLLVAYAGDTIRVGAEYFTASNWNQVPGPRRDKAAGYSVWGSVALNDEISLFARHDQARLSRIPDSAAKNLYTNLGVQYQVSKGLKLAAVWKHESGDKSVSTPLPLHVQTVTTNEIGIWGELAF